MKESEMVKTINILFKKNGILHANEIRMGIGIPDIMVGINTPEDHKSIIDYYALKIYYLIINNNIRSVSEAIEKSLLTKRHLLRCIHLLSNSEIIKVVNDSISVEGRIDEKIGVNVSIEAKIKNWKEGLLQAQRYLTFSDYSYLAMPEENFHLVEIDLFEDIGIGLLKITDDFLYEIVPPRKSTICDPLFKYISISSMLDKIEDSYQSSLSDSHFLSVL